MYTADMPPDVQSRAQAMGAPANVTQYLVSMINAASFFGRILPGLAADHLGGLNCWTFVAFSSGIVLLAGWTTVKSAGGLVGITILYGFVSCTSAFWLLCAL